MKKYLLLFITCLSISFSNAQFSSNFTEQQPSSNSTCDGWLSVQTWGGFPTIIWNGNDTILPDTMAAFHHDTLWNLCQGVYYVDIIDTSGITAHYDFFFTSLDYTFGSPYTSLDSVVSVYAEDCNINYSAPIDTAYLDNINFIGFNSSNIDTLISTWHVIQTPVTHVIIDTIFDFFPSTNFVLNAAIFCPDSVLKANSFVGSFIHVTSAINRSVLAINKYSISSNGVVVYPNPFITNFTIKPEKHSLITGYKVFNVAGKLIVSDIGLLSPEEQIKLTSFPSGIYFLTVKLSNGGFFTKKIVKI